MHGANSGKKVKNYYLNTITSNLAKMPLNDITNTSGKKVSSSKPSYSCCVSHCENKSSNTVDVNFYKFPTSNPHYPHKKERYDNWVKAVRLQRLDGSPWVPENKSVICSKHFVGNKKSNDPRSPSYHPTIFPLVYKKLCVNSEQALNRYRRVLKRPNQQFSGVFNLKKRKIDTMLNHQSSADISMPDHSQTIVCENVTESTNNVENSAPSKTQIDCGVQVDFTSIDNVVHDIFMCNRYIFATGTSEAETQCHFAGSKGKVKIEVVNDSKKEETIPTASVKTSNCNRGFHGYESIKKEQALSDIAGVSRATFQLFVKILLKDRAGKCTIKNLRQKISDENKVLIFLMKMKCGLTFAALGVFFKVHRTTIFRIFYTILDYFSVACRNFVKWPDKLVVQETMPLAFEAEYSNCRVIIDATEFCVESPHNVGDQVQFFSHYKKGYRVKVVVGCTPGGFISLVSQSHGGRGTDSQITVASNLLNLLEPGDIVLADKGFPQIKSVLDEKGDNILIVMPPFLNKEEQFTEEEVDATYSVASVRIHIERIMQRLRTHKILEKLTVKMLPYIDKIIFMACVLVNLQRPMIKEKKRDIDMHN